MKKTKLAFSLIELSVVILIIGILVIGITKGSRIIGESKLKAAKSLTAGSPVNSMTGLALWLDATDSQTIAVGSVGSGVYGSPNNGDLVSDWKDRNTQSSSSIIFSALADANRPVYTKNGIGGLPDLMFDGSATDFLRYTNTNGILGSGIKIHTIIMVFTVSNTSSGAYLINQGTICDGSNLGMIVTGTAFLGAIGCGGGDYTSGAAVIKNTPYIGIIRMNNTFTGNKVKAYLNKSTSSGSAPVVDAVAGNTTIGARYDGSIITGNVEHISEVIVFNRSITDNEITAIQEYLSKKYSIKM